MNVLDHKTLKISVRSLVQRRRLRVPGELKTKIDTAVLRILFPDFVLVHIIKCS